MTGRPSLFVLALFAPGTLVTTCVATPRRANAPPNDVRGLRRDEVRCPTRSSSPDGRTVLYAVRTTDVEANRRAATTYIQTSGGSAARAFPDDTTHAAEARWSPDGRRVAYTAGGQLWVANADGSGRAS